MAVPVQAFSPLNCITAYGNAFDSVWTLLQARIPLCSGPGGPVSAPGVVGVASASLVRLAPFELNLSFAAQFKLQP